MIAQMNIDCNRQIICLLWDDMRNSISLSLSLIIFLLFCFSGSYCEPIFGSDANSIASVVAADNLMHGPQHEEGDCHPESHTCHFGHACHCASDVPRKTVFIILSLSLLILDGRNLIYESPTIDGLVRPPIT